MDDGGTPWTLSPDQVLVGRYRILAPLGRGGIGEVYEALDLELEERIAVKVLRAAMAREERTLRRFKREIQLARRVTHPNVCRTFDLVVAGERGADAVPPFLTMELLHGETLADRLERLGRLEPVDAMPVVEGIVAALAAAHAAGIVHRDLKTSNVFLEDSGRVVITDFGLARNHDFDSHEETTLTVTGEMMGSPAYMAPEQVRGERVTAATDLYALGVVLFEMVTGELPFRGRSAFYTALKRLQDPPPSPRSRVPSLDRRWDVVILRCLSRRPEDRFDDAPTVLEALRGADPPPRGRLQRFRSRRRFVILGGLLVLLVPAVWGLWSLRSALSPPRSGGSARGPAERGVFPQHGDTSRVELSTARVFGATGEVSRQLESARRAEVLARAVGDRPLEGAAILESGIALCRMRRVREGDGALSRVIVDFADVASPELQIRALVELAHCRKQRRETRDAAADAAEQAIALAESLGNALRRAEAYCARGRPEDLATAERIFRDLDQPGGLARTLLSQADLAAVRRDAPSVRTLAGEALRLFRQVGDRHGEIWALLTLARAQDGEGSAEGKAEAAEGIRRAVELSRATGNQPLLRIALQFLAGVEKGRGRRAVARRWADEALVLSRRLGDQEGMAWAHNFLGVVVLREGDLEQAESYLWQAAEGFRALGSPSRAADALHSLAETFRRKGELTRAAVTYREALRELSGEGEPPSSPADRSRWAASSHGLARVLADLGQGEAAWEAFTTAINLWRELGSGAELSFAELDRETLLPREEVEAEAPLGIVKALAAVPQDHEDYPRALLQVAEVHRRAGRPEQAQAMLEEALTLFEKEQRRLGVAESFCALGAATLDRGLPAEAWALIAECLEEARKRRLPWLELRALLLESRIWLVRSEPWRAQAAWQEGGEAARRCEHVQLLSERRLVAVQIERRLKP